MDQIGFVFVEFADLLLEIRSVHIDVRRTRNVAGFEFLLCADIEHNGIGVLAQFLKLRDIDVLNLRIRAKGSHTKEGC